MKTAIFIVALLLTGCAHETRAPTGHECHGPVTLADCKASGCLLVGACAQNCNPPPPDIATRTCNPDGSAGNCS